MRRRIVLILAVLCLLPAMGCVDRYEMVQASNSCTPEVGSWTPVDASVAGLGFTTSEGQYSKCGRLVTAWFRVIYPATEDMSVAAIGGLPFASESTGMTRPIQGSASNIGVTFGGTLTGNVGITGTGGVTYFELSPSAGEYVHNNAAAHNQYTGMVTYLID